MLDVLFGLAIVTTLTIALAIAVSESSRGVKRIRTTTQAIAIAEQLLNDLHMGRRPPEDPDGYAYRIDPVDGGDRAVGNGRWVRITVRLGDRRADLIGVIPEHMREVIQ